MLFRNFYRCATCGCEWTDVWPAQCDDDCPLCGARHMSPYKSEDVSVQERRREESDMNKIALLNDAFRTTLLGGTVLLSAEVHELPDMVKAAAIRKVVSFDEFTEDNDPYGEHDFGKFELCNRRFFWKIDYFDERGEFGSEDPADPEKTTRILTILLASEY